MAKHMAIKARLFTALFLTTIFLVTTGCGHVKNVRDDILDCGTFAVGVVPPVVPGGDKPKAVGLIPPAFGVYLQVTDFFHLGGLVKHTGDLEWDRRGLGAVADHRIKWGLGPMHYVRINQQHLLANAYKRKGNKLDGWRAYMDNLRDPVFDAKAKTLIYDDYFEEPLPFLYRGWQDWEGISLEVAIPEPFITHSGYYMRAGVNPCQIFDAVLSLFCFDLYADSAYKFFSGKPKYTAER